MAKKAPVQATLSFDESESGSAFSFISPVKDPNPLPKKEPESPGIITVSELGERIRDVLDCELLTGITVTGEVTGYRPNSSGHLYFSLTEKGDIDAAVSCVMWKYAAKHLAFPLKDGLAVNITGHVDYYPPSGRMQFIVKKIEPASGGKTGLYLQKEMWKKQLEAEGIIPRPESEKRDPPLFPKCVGVVTSRTGSVLQDIRNVLSRRYPLPVLLAPAQVQGAGAEVSIVSAIESLQGKVDVIIVARGGGSFEDLFVFNHPDVVRAIRRSKVPIISAVGHETDTTLSDFASDRRVPTPSAAAETVVPDRTVLLNNLEEYRRRMHDRARGIISTNRSAVAELKMRVDPSRLSRRLDMMHQQTADIEERIKSAFSRKLKAEADGLEQLAERIFKGAKTRISTAVLELSAQKEKILSCDPKKPLERGYALVQMNGTVIRSKEQLKKDDSLTLCLSDGEVTAIVEKIS
ncbi:MAG TPA: exodeoxyribonuclease VII large subunit [Methanocorpusculum sp.]|nr:exodeoxyribonuclease VII large subunit [Methanocorpusculum sp.]HJJ78987.1 exodeoxyribonuclease VII large subunit [Methanocorpusculum sp.]